MTKAGKRTFIGVALFVPLAAILLLTFACLPAPVGDPDQSKVDPKLTGAWQAQDDKSTVIALLRPWDAHTYYLQYMTNGKSDQKDGSDKPGVMHFKAWLTALGGATFLTAEPLDRLDYAFGPDDDKKPFWIVGRVELKDDAITFRPVKPDSSIVKDLTTSDKIEAAIKAHVNDDELYGDSLTFKKIPKENAKLVEDAMKNFHIGDGN